MRALLAILIAMSCVACSKADADRTSSDAKTAANDVAHDPGLKQLGSDIKADALHAKFEIKKEAAKAKIEIARAGEQAKRDAQDAKDKAREKADESKDNG